MHTCLFSIVHRFFAQCIFSVPKPTLSVKTFINVCPVNYSPCLEKEEILFSQGPLKRKIKNQIITILTQLNYPLICWNSITGWITGPNSQDGLLEAKETDMTNITPATHRTNRIEACCLKPTAQSFSLGRLLHFLLLTRKLQLDGNKPQWGKRMLPVIHGATSPSENSFPQSLLLKPTPFFFFFPCVNENRDPVTLKEKHFNCGTYT